ncbi:DMT family transporter [Corynebacterium sp.]|uniref:DMT family transporter n=1 Tax=Corynebacterium sp. TaxID=1720 RepID=UPI0026DAE059|nr:DMT family transporter [Corynebacterium sp.]MDO5031730.1 DMT family transporter [Corynebacterium sp.]
MLLLGILAGLVLPVQTVVNTRLRASTGTPLSASMVSFSVGTLCLSIAVAISLLRGGEFGIGAATNEPAWIWLGGALGVVALTGNILLFPHLGGVQTVVMPIAGQIVMGLVIDHFGLFSSPQSPLNLLRLIGAIVVFVGVILVVGTPRDMLDKLLPWRVAGFIFGCFTAAQSAVNGHLGDVADSALSAALVSFLVGASTLLLANLALRWRPRVAVPAGESRNPWWMWTGGVLGAVFVAANAALVPAIGTGLTVVAGLLGMMMGSLAVDRLRGLTIRGGQVAGILVILAGVIVIRFLG